MKKQLKIVLQAHLPSSLYDAIVVSYWRVKNRFATRYELESRFLRHFIRPGDLVVDLGVNLGQYTTVMAGLVGPRGYVIGFEALPSTYALARRIVRGKRNVTLHNLAVSSKGGILKMKLFYDEENLLNRGLSSIVPDDSSSAPGQVVEVRSVTLDEMLADRRQRVAFIKCDVEGHEVGALSGGMNVISKDEPFILLETGRRNFNTVRELLGSLGYFPTQAQGPGKLMLAGECQVDSANYFFIKDRSAVSSLLV